MKNRIFNIPITGMSINEVFELNTEMSVTGYNKNIDEVVLESKTLYPGQIIIKNDSGSNISYNTFSSDDEYKEYTDTPEYFDFIPIEDGEIISNGNPPRIKKMLIKKLDGTSIKNIEIQCINYR